MTVNLIVCSSSFELNVLLAPDIVQLMLLDFLLFRYKALS